MSKKRRRPLEGFDKTLLGVIAVVVIVVLVSLIVGLNQLSLGHREYRGEFAQAAQIGSGDQVTVAGISVGEVSGVALAGDHVSVTFSVKNDVHLGRGSRAAIKLTTLLGRRYVELSPAAGGELADRTIPLSNTSVPYNLQATLADATTTFEEVDADRVAKSMTTLGNGLAGVPEALPQALANVKSLADIITARRDQIGSLLKNVDTLTATLRDQKANLGALLIQGRDLLGEAVSRSQAVHRLFTSVTAMVDQLEAILNDDPAINTLLDHLTELSRMIGQRDELLRNTLQTTTVAFRNLTNASGSGNALDINLPAGVFIDSWMCALSARGKQFNLAQYFSDCQPGPEAFPGWPPPDPEMGPR